MDKKVFSFAVCAILLLLCLSAQGQQPTKVSRIGFLNAGFPATSPARAEAFRQSLRELGYIEGKNIVIEWRYADGKPDRLAALAAELVSLKVDVIVTGGGISTRSAKDATVTIPIVMTQDIDPVRNGFIASLARPSGNITGLSTLGPEISGKRLELLKETISRLLRVAVLGNLTEDLGNAQALKEIELAAGAFGVKVQHLDVQNPKDIEAAFREASKARAEAILTLNLPPNIETRIAELAVKRRLPAIYFESAIVVKGGLGLMSYGVSLADLDRRAAVYVDKILKGAKPADLPVEQPIKFEFIINLKTAKQMGLAIPPNVLARADRVIR